MNVRRADRPRYWVVYLLKDLEVGATFNPDLLHLTIVPWFVVDKDEAEIVNSFHGIFSGEKTFEVTVGKADEFSHDRMIPINVIEPSPQIHELHSKALAWLDSLDARWALKNPHAGNDYIAHIRRRQGHNRSVGEKILINSLSLVRAHRRGDNFRIVAAKVEFQ